MKVKIGVFGSSGKPTKELGDKAFELGKEVAVNGCILVTGATTGLPSEAARGAKEAGGFTIGISPAASEEDHTKTYGLPTENHDIIVYDGSGLKGRNVTNIRACDCALFISGGMGTLNEFTVAYDEGKSIGILSGTGGMTKLVKDVIRTCGMLPGKHKKTKVFYDSDPGELVKKLLEAVK